jgi:uncharacterized membrane protein
MWRNRTSDIEPAIADRPPYDTTRQRSSSRQRLLVAASAGVAVASAAAAVEPWQIATLLGWATISAVMVVWVWLIILRLDAAQTAEHAGRKDPSAGWTHVLLLCASVASLAAVAFVFARAGGTGTSLVALVALGVASIALSWTLVHTMFTLHYARLYYSDPGGGIDFNQEQPPCYHDFAYVAFTVGMTFQVSDTDLRTPAIRHTALRHALLSYLFGSIILAGTINLVAGLTK